MTFVPVRNPVSPDSSKDSGARPISVYPLTMKRLLSGFLLMFAVFSQCLAESDVTRHAELAIRDLIRKETPWKKIYFTRSDDNFFSSSEAKVTGEGVVSDKDDWGGKTFKYSIKVHRRELRTRDGEVSFAGGLKVTQHGDWEKPSRAWRKPIEITTPRWYQELRGDRVVFAGTASGSGKIRMTIFDRSNQRVESVSDKPDRDGKWSMEVKLNAGTYRAVATQSGGWSDSDEVRFVVGKSNGDWGWDGPDRGPIEVDVKITSPRNRDDIRGPRVRMTGESSADKVFLTITDRRGKVVYRETVSSDRRDRWSADTRLEEGEYKLVAESGRRKDEVSFRVR